MTNEKLEFGSYRNAIPNIVAKNFETYTDDLFDKIEAEKNVVTKLEDFDFWQHWSKVMIKIWASENECLNSNQDNLWKNGWFSIEETRIVGIVESSYIPLKKNLGKKFSKNSCRSRSLENFGNYFRRYQHREHFWC